jgi:hypothetical protein
MDAARGVDLRYELQDIFRGVLDKNFEELGELLINRPGRKVERRSTQVTSDHEVRHAVFLVDGKPYDVLPSDLKQGEVQLVWSKKQVSEPKRKVR